MPFLNRWLIQGTLTVRTPLRIGDGGVITASERGNCEYLAKWKQGRKVDEEIEISSMAMDAAGRAYIPGTTLKGNLLAWARACRMPDKLLDCFFGRGPRTVADQFAVPTRDANTVAGKVQFWDAQAVVDQSCAFKFAPPGWHEQRLTGVAASVAIDRRTRTASEKKLFHQEYIPPGVSFVLTLSGNDAGDEDEAARDDQGLLELLTLLEGFNRNNGVTLGAEADGLGDGWGRLIWNLTTIKRLDHDGVKRWLESGGRGVGYEMLEVWEDGQRDALRLTSEAKSKERARTAHPRNHISVQVALQCLENFIVNDPSQTNHPDLTKEDEEDTQQNKLPDHAPLRDIEGHPLLPRRSVKGAVRGQAEKILRTMGGDRAACHADDPKRSCRPVAQLQQAKNLCLACQVFGASGWKSPFNCTPFIAPEETKTKRQEFVAIDRFTGGAAHRKKFDAVAFYQPELEGEFGLDLAALERVGRCKAALGLLALTLRDLLEGDIRIGFGKAKGYGEIEARMSLTVPLPAAWSELPQTFCDAVVAEEYLAEAAVVTSHAEFCNSLLGLALQDCVMELENLCRKLKAKEK